jgi:hypothetical protein
VDERFCFHVQGAGAMSALEKIVKGLFAMFNQFHFPLL